MSWPIGKVPEGWTRGESLRRSGHGPRFALVQNMTAAEGFERFVVNRDATQAQIYAITFDSEADRERFVDWWHDRVTADPNQE